MRKIATFVIFAGVAVLAACGGGGGSHMLPTGGSIPGGNGGSGGTSAIGRSASMSIRIPPANQQMATKRRAYVPSSTASFGVLAESASSSQTPAPSNEQIFPVATPSPCAAASGGGEVCTLTVTAPIGVDKFWVLAYAVASPSANATPLAQYEADSIDVSASPSAAATPIPFALNAVVAAAVVTVASPDPGNTPNTQVLTAAVPGVASLSVAALDANNENILADPSANYATPIEISASPSTAGVTLAFANASSCGSAIVSGVAQIACGADLSNLVAQYDGSTHPDSNDHVIDTFEITAEDEPSPSPSPATIVL